MDAGIKEGAHIGDYVVEGLAGSGGMSRVYRARHRVLGSLHALKVLRTGHGEDPVVRDRFVKEGQVLAQLVHPALVRVTDVVFDRGVAALVMDFLAGQDLRRHLKPGPMSPEGAANVVLQALSGIGYAHRARVFHRDLKPANVFLVDRPDGGFPDVKLLDFGIAKVADSFVTRGSTTMGTAAYMSPEQIEHAGEVDARSDVFSLGVVLFEMVAGYRPFSGDSDFTVMERITSGNRRRIPDTAGPLAAVLEQALATQPSDRFDSAEAFMDAVSPHARREVRERVASWVGAGTVDPVASDKARDAWAAPPVRAPAPPAVPDAPMELPVRWLGSLQLTSGVINAGVMSAVQCFGIGWLGGLPACFGFLLLGVGLVEIGAGMYAVAFNSPRWLRATAWLEVASLAGLGIVSAVVGVVVLWTQTRHQRELAG